MSTSVAPRAVMAAGNNADLYQIMFEVHGIPYQRLPSAFVGQDRPPPYYSDITILRPGAALETEMRGVVGRSGGPIGLKDSFSELEYAAYGFEKLFDANWIWRDAHANTLPQGWRVISEPDALIAWEAAWKVGGSPTPQRVFPALLLKRSDIFFLAKVMGDKVQAGCIVNLSEDCAGLSNVFASADEAHAYAEAANAAASLAKGLPLVGYEHGASLDHAQSAGFEITGQLRVLFTPMAEFPPR